MQSNMLNRIVVSLLFFGYYFSLSRGGMLNMKPCTKDPKLAPPNGNTLLVNVALEGCENQSCTLIYGETYLAEANFTTNFSSKYLLMSISFMKGSVTFPFLSNINLCDYTVFGQCENSTPGTKFGFMRTVKLPEDAVIGDYVGVVQFKDDVGVTRFCGEINILLKKKMLGGMADNMPFFG